MAFLLSGDKMSETSFSFSVTQKYWMQHTENRWNNGLVRSGMAFHNGLSRTHYPPLPASGIDARTFTTAKKANFRIVVIGQEMEFGSTNYLPKLLRAEKPYQNWVKKKPEILAAMQKAFAKGIKMNTSTNDGSNE